MSKPEPGLIKLGGGKTIRTISSSYSIREAVQIDSLLAASLPLWEALELGCVAECCGLAAFSFLPEDIARAAVACDAEVLASLAKLESEIAGLSANSLISDRLNQGIERTPLLELLAHIRSCLPAQEQNLPPA